MLRVFFRVSKIVITVIYIITLLMACAGENSRPKNNFLVSVAQLEKASPGILESLFVDIRDKNNFNKVHIKNSLNINPHFLPSKTFLKEKNVILIYGGINKSLAIKIATDASKAGFKSVRVLDGGITAWIEAGQRVESAPGAFEDLYKIKPCDLYSAVKAAPDSIIIATLNTPEMPDEFSPKVKTIQLEQLDCTFREKINKSTEDTRIPVIIVDKDGSKIREVIKKIRSCKLKQVFYLEGGVASYRNYVRTMHLVTEGKKHLGKRFNKGCE